MITTIAATTPINIHNHVIGFSLSYLAGNNYRMEHKVFLSRTDDSVGIPAITDHNVSRRYRVNLVVIMLSLIHI